MKTYNLLSRKIAMPVIAVVAIVSLASFTLSSAKKEVSKPDSKLLQTQIVYGSAVQTHGLHNSTNCACGRYEHRHFANSLFAKHTLRVSVPSGWHFTGKPFVNCVINDQGAFEWNNFAGSPDRFIITQSTPDYIEAVVWAGSRQITINLACEATKD